MDDQDWVFELYRPVRLFPSARAEAHGRSFPPPAVKGRASNSPVRMRKSNSVGGLTFGCGPVNAVSREREPILRSCGRPIKPEDIFFA
jgi:hypothetical protein